MKKFSKALSVLLVLALALSLCACGKETVGSNTGKTENGKQVWYLGGNNIMAGKVDVEALFAEEANTVDPAKIYSSITLTEEMLHGVYTLNNKEKDLKKMRETIPFADVHSRTATPTT